MKRHDIFWVDKHSWELAYLGERLCRFEISCSHAFTGRFGQHYGYINTYS